jgi:chromosomal replication initiator protein
VENLAPVLSDPLSPTSWDRVLAALRPLVNPGAYETWFRPTRLAGQAGSVLQVAVPNEMFAEWLRSQYMPAIRNVLPVAGVGVTDVEFLPPRPMTSVAEPPSAPATPLNTRYTFDNFVVSSCNQFAHAAALAVSDQPGRAYNPLFLYGFTGLGKTHLMQAIGNRVVQSRPGTRLRYLSSEQFVNELINAIRFEETPEFRDRYRSVDVLLVDDIQFLAGKEGTQEEFFHTFNALYDSGRQIVITSDCPPRSIPALEERLRSRFEWGLLADIQPPDLETKVAILNKMAASRGWSVPSEVALFIAGNITSNIRELEGCLTTLMAASSVRRVSPDLSLARDVVRSLVPAEPEPVTLDTVLMVVSRHFNLKVADLKTRTNAQRIAFPRQIAMYFCKRLARESLPTIGKVFGGKHHTTVLHAVHKIQEQRLRDPAFNKTLEQLEEQLR